MKHFYKIAVIVGLILWIAETAYFGWNRTPGSPIEGVLDVVSFLLMFWGTLGDIATNLTIKKETTIKANTVTVHHYGEE